MLSLNSLKNLQQLLIWTDRFHVGSRSKSESMELDRRVKIRLACPCAPCSVHRARAVHPRNERRSQPRTAASSVAANSRHVR